MCVTEDTMHKQLQTFVQISSDTEKSENISWLPKKFGVTMKSWKQVKNKKHVGKYVQKKIGNSKGKVGGHLKTPPKLRNVMLYGKQEIFDI